MQTSQRLRHSLEKFLEIISSIEIPIGSESNFKGVIDLIR